MKLIVVHEGVKFEFPLPGRDVIVGRAKNCDLSLDDPSMSSKHFILRKEGNEYFVQDLLSKNGTFVDGQKVHIAKLCDGAVITAGKVNFTFVTGAGSAGTTPEAVSAHSQSQYVGGAHAAVSPASGGQQRDAMTSENRDALLPEKYDQRKVKLVARGDRLFMIDGESGRELELVPVRKSDAAAGPGLKSIGSDVLIRHKKLLVAAAAALLCLSLSVAVVVLTADKAPPSPGDDSISTNLYSQRIDQAIALFRKLKLQEAQEVLDELKKSAPGNRLAFVLSDAVGLWHGVAADYSNFDWRKAKTLFQELLGTPGATPDAQALAREKLGWITKEGENEALAYEALKYKHRGDLEKAYRAFKKITTESIYRQRYANEIEATRISLRANLIASARELCGKGGWKEAIDIVKRCIELCGSDHELVELIATCERNISALAAIQQARKLISEGRPDAASDILASLPHTHAYVREAEEILGEIYDARSIEQALELYNNGQAEQAIELLQKATSKYATTLRDKISKVAKTYDEYRNAISDDRLDDALRHMTSIRALETNRDNHYRIMADEFIEQVTADPRGMARKYLELATKRYGEHQYKKARSLAEKALSHDPLKELGHELIKTILSKATQFYNEALNIKSTDSQKARLLLEKALDLLIPEDGHLYTRVLEQLDELK